MLLWLLQNTSSANTNRRGERGSPYLSPLVALKCPIGPLFNMTDILANCNIADNLSVNKVEKLNFFNEDKLEDKLNKQPPKLKDNKSVQDDIFVQVMILESRGHVCSAGIGGTPSGLGLTQRILEKKKEDEDGRASVSTLK
ncbi:hypothetical protein NE237_004632 [Protea cynaroides]|uniref:Uncharacterized protein n=1 Tax=Protea cynaroides TaxID=273540 RepID=A0A9Q0QTP6_9MAGN|nr:hypothetical protein NE237_004632 [Protea cynaroides]